MKLILINNITADMTQVEADDTNNNATVEGEKEDQSANSSDNNQKPTQSFDNYDSTRESSGVNDVGGAQEQHNNQEEAYDAVGASSSRQNLPHVTKWTKDHTPDLIIGNPELGGQTYSATQNECLFHNFLSKEEPKKVEDALLDH